MKDDFFNVAFKYDEIAGREIPLDEPILITYYVTKWLKAGEPHPTIDFNICWAGVLTKSAIKDAILDVPVVCTYAKD